MVKVTESVTRTNKTALVIGRNPSEIFDEKKKKWNVTKGEKTKKQKKKQKNKKTKINNKSKGMETLID